MATLMAAVGAAVKGAGLAGALQIGGTLLSAGSAIAQGRSQQAAANYQAAQLDAQGKSENAVAQRAAMEERRQKELVLSRARAVGAASGGGQDFALLGDIEEEGAYREGVALWEGEESAKGRKNQAGAARFEGKQYAKAGFMKAGSTLLQGGSSFYENYG